MKTTPIQIEHVQHHEGAQPQDSQHQNLQRHDMLIGVLSITAVILLVSLLLVQWMPAPALATGMTTSSGGFVMTVGAWTIGDEEIVFLLDSSSNKMVAYRFDPSTRQIAVVQGIDLAPIRPPGQP